MRVGECFQRFVNVFAIIDADGPVLENLHGIFAGGTHFLVGVAFLYDHRLVRGVAGLVSQIVERHDRALECDFARVLGADLIERLVRGRDRVFVIASTASGVCSQSGIVRTAFAFAAAARKSSTVFRFSARRVAKRARAGVRARTKRKIFMRKGLVDGSSEDCVEDLIGKAKTL